MSAKRWATTMQHYSLHNAHAHCTRHNLVKNVRSSSFFSLNSCAVGIGWGFRIACIHVSVLNWILNAMANVPFGYLFMRFTVFDGIVVVAAVFCYILISLLFVARAIHRLKNWKTMNRHCWVVYSVMESNRIEWNWMKCISNKFIAYV